MTYTGDIISAVTVDVSGIVSGNTIGLIPTITAKEVGTNTSLSSSGMCYVVSSTTYNSGATYAISNTTSQFIVISIKAGDYSVSVALTTDYSTYPDAESYEITSIYTQAFTINKKAVTISWAGYNSEASATFDGNNHGVVATVKVISLSSDVLARIL